MVVDALQSSENVLRWKEKRPWSLMKKNRRSTNGNYIRSTVAGSSARTQIAMLSLNPS